jgi:cytochrome c oxidase subunit 4
MEKTTMTESSITNEDGHGLSHVLPVKLLAAIWVSLMVLTFATVAVTWVQLGGMNLWIALAIATLKATLVALYFMHLRYDRPIHAIVFITAFVFLMLFVGLALTDTAAYKPEMIPGYAPEMQQK